MYRLAVFVVNAFDNFGFNKRVGVISNITIAAFRAGVGCVAAFCFGGFGYNRNIVVMTYCFDGLMEANL